MIAGVETGCSAVDLGVSEKSVGAGDAVRVVVVVVVRTLVGFEEFDGLGVSERRMLIHRVSESCLLQAEGTSWRW